MGISLHSKYRKKNMSFFYHILGVLAMICLAACTMTTGPQKTLDEIAVAMDNNNPAAFISHFDMQEFAANYAADLAKSDDALNALNSIGSFVGNFLGLNNLNENMNELLDSIVDFRGRLEQRFERGVASGELMAQCRKAETPDCPWVPSSLRDAQIVELGPEAAIAKITTPARLTSWLAMRKFGDQWKIVGHAVMEATARKYALEKAGGRAVPSDESQASNSI